MVFFRLEQITAWLEPQRQQQVRWLERKHQQQVRRLERMHQQLVRVQQLEQPRELEQLLLSYRKQRGQQQR